MEEEPDSLAVLRGREMGEEIWVLRGGSMTMITTFSKKDLRAAVCVALGVVGRRSFSLGAGKLQQRCSTI